MVELGLPPEGYFCKGGNEVWPVHEVQVLRRLVCDTVDRYDMVVYRLATTVSKLIFTEATLGSCTLSSSSVEADNESRVTRIANCFLVLLSRKECASTMAPDTSSQHQMCSRVSMFLPGRYASLVSN